jgi:hypothetical protein
MGGKDREAGQAVGRRAKEAIAHLRPATTRGIDITSSVEVVMKCVSHYRIPNLLRRADKMARRLSGEHSGDTCLSLKK